MTSSTLTWWKSSKAFFQRISFIHSMQKNLRYSFRDSKTRIYVKFVDLNRILPNPFNNIHHPKGKVLKMFTIFDIPIVEIPKIV